MTQVTPDRSPICTAPRCGRERGHGGGHAVDNDAYKLHETWFDWLPTSGKVEIHLTYACNLDCVGCNRASWLMKPHTPNMTLQQAADYFTQARAIGFDPEVMIVGGEPTLHPQFLDFIQMARANTNQIIQVWSNGSTDQSRKLLRDAARLHGASIEPTTHKQNGAVTTAPDRDQRGWSLDAYVSARDHGELLRQPCFAHSSRICGLSVDAGGYSICAMGGMVDAMLGLGVRTTVLADLFDHKKATEMTAALCMHCGWRYGPFLKAAVSDCEEVCGVPMSSTWRKAFAGKE